MVSSGLLRRVVLTRATRRNNPEDTILHSHRRENLKSYEVTFNLPLTRFILKLYKIKGALRLTVTGVGTQYIWLCVMALDLLLDHSFITQNSVAHKD
jgi:hypothetical protein